jgi:hypothetical protein
MPIESFNPSGYAAMSAPPPTPEPVTGAAATSARQALPGGGGPTLVITNLGPSAAVVLLGNENVTVTLQTGMAVLANDWVALAVDSNTHLAAIGAQDRAALNLAQGT